MLDKEFLNKVCEQIISETRIDDNKVYTPFSPLSPPLFFLSFLSFPSFSSNPHFFYNHCKGIYSLNKEETEYVWNRYKVEITTLMDKKELIHKEKV